MKSQMIWVGSLIASLVLAPLLSGIINKVKAFFAGRRGPRILQLYSDMYKLLKKGRVYSSMATGVFGLAPVIALAALLASALFVPFGMVSSSLAFGGDMILFFYLAGLSRMFTVLGALDTGSSFEGMGASREVEFSAMSEMVIFAILAVLALLSKSWTLAGVLGASGESMLHGGAMSVILAATSFFVVILAECCRVPFDDPETHLELTMIHEAMILDNSGPDLAMIHYGAALKMWLLISFFVMMLLPASQLGVAGCVATYFGGVLLTAVLIGIVESVMGRFRFLKVPQMFFGALATSLLAIILLVAMELA